MGNTKAEMLKLVREWRQVLREIDADSRLSSAGKAEKQAEAHKRYSTELRQWAQQDLRHAQIDVDRATQALAAARRESTSHGDGAWQLALHMEAQQWAQSVTSWEDATAQIQEAIEDGDVQRVRSLQRIAVPVLEQRARSDEALRQNNSTVVTLRRQLDEAAAALRPEALRKAEESHRAALHAQESLLNDLGTVDIETAQATGAGYTHPGVLRDIVSPVLGVI